MKFQLKYAWRTPSQNTDLLRLHLRDPLNTFLSQTHPPFTCYSTLFCQILPHYSKPTFLPNPDALPSFSLSAISELSNRKNAAAAAHQDFFSFPLGNFRCRCRESSGTVFRHGSFPQPQPDAEEAQEQTPEALEQVALVLPQQARIVLLAVRQVQQQQGAELQVKVKIRASPVPGRFPRSWPLFS